MFAADDEAHDKDSEEKEEDDEDEEQTTPTHIANVSGLWNVQFCVIPWSILMIYPICAYRFTIFCQSQLQFSLLLFRAHLSRSL